MLSELMPGETEVRALLALLMITDARRATRVDAAAASACRQALALVANDAERAFIEERLAALRSAGPV